MEQNSLNKVEGEFYHFSLLREDATINGYVLKPIGDGPFPAVTLAHGGFSSAEDVVLILGRIFVKEEYVAIACNYTHMGALHVKYRNEGGKEGWGPGASKENLARALETIEILKNLKFVNKNRIAMMGNSMGGFLTVGVAQTTKDIKAAIVVVAGIKDSNPQTPHDIFLESLSPREELVKNISCPMLLLNGEDDMTVPVKYPKHLKELLDKHAKTCKLIIYPNVGHMVLALGDRIWKEVFGFLNEYLQR